MTDPSTTYEIGRMSVVIERTSPEGSDLPWVICVNRRASERFVSTGAVVWCSTRENAQTLARILVGVEYNREGKVIWPDGRTEPTEPEAHPLDREGVLTFGSGDPAHDLIHRLVAWVDMQKTMVGRDARVWAEARAFVRPDELGD